MVFTVIKRINALLRNCLKKSSEEDGSLAPLVIGLFLIASLTSIALVDYSSVILKQRLLDQNNERALQRAAHEIDLGHYYTHGLDKFTVVGGESSSEFRVPIDCKKAYRTYWEELFNSITIKDFGTGLDNGETQSHFQDGWRIESFTCDGDSVYASISQHTPLPFQLPILRIYEATIHAKASAYSVTN
jgi:hypothetical protein